MSRISIICQLNLFVENNKIWKLDLEFLEIRFQFKNSKTPAFGKRKPILSFWNSPQLEWLVNLTTRAREREREARRRWAASFGSPRGENAKTLLNDQFRARRWDVQVVSQISQVEDNHQHESYLCDCLLSSVCAIEWVFLLTRVSNSVDLLLINIYSTNRLSTECSLPREKVTRGRVSFIHTIDYDLWTFNEWKL